MNDVVRQLLRAIARHSHFLGRLIYRAAYPGARISGSASLEISGVFLVGKDVSIGERAIISVPADASLVLGDDSYVGRDVEIGPGKRVSIGASTSIQDRCILLGDVSIGSHCIFAPNVYVSSGHHHYDLEPWQLIRDQDLLAAASSENAGVGVTAVVIEDDCWLGANVVVMQGIRIGKGAVVGANAVVTKDVEPYTVIAGAPARLIKRRLDFVPPEKISSDSPHDLPYFYSGFQVSRACLRENLSNGGIVAGSPFSIALSPNARTLTLLVRSNSHEAVSISHGEQDRVVSTQWQEASFDIEGHCGGNFTFLIKGQGGAPEVIVKAAWSC